MIQTEKSSDFLGNLRISCFCSRQAASWLGKSAAYLGTAVMIRIRPPAE